MTNPDAERDRLIAALCRVAERDSAALRQVYDMTSSKLFGICLRVSADRDAAEDILQDVYVKVWNRAGRFDAGRASPITWLCTIARNTAIDWCRSSYRPGTVPAEAADHVVDTALSADMMMERDQDSARIVACLDTLDERQRSSISSACLDGLTYAQLADRMAVPLGTMKGWIRRGLQQLKVCLGDG